MTPVISSASLSAICEIKTGKRDANHGDNGGEYPFFTCADKPILSPTFSFDGDCIILPGNGANVGLVLCHSGKFEAYQRTYILSNFKCDFRYLYHHLNAYWRRNNELKQYGSATNYIKMQNFDDYMVPLPPIAEQRRIAAILDKADAIRRKRKQAIQYTEELLRANFLDMFGDPVNNPKGWEVVELKETFARNPQIGTTKPAHGDGEQLIIRVGEVGSKNIQLENCGRITLEGSDLQKNLCEPGDFFIVRAIGSESHLGKASILQNTNEIIVFDSHVMRLRFSSNKLLPEFFLEWLKTKGGRCRFMKEAGRTAVQFNVNAKQISRVKIPLPPLFIQKQFVKLYKQFSISHEHTDNSAQAIDALFNSLLQRAFRGEL